MKWDVWYQLMLPDAISRLEALRQAILKWTDLAQKEFAARWEGQEGVADPRADWGYTPQADDALLLDQTERVMFASLAVAIMSAIETFTREVCATAGVQFVHKKGKKKGSPIDRPNWGHYRCGLESKLGIEFASMPGFSGCTRARLLGNCFKHNSGKTNDEYVAEYRGSRDVEIEYEKENWPDLIDATRTFLVGLASKIRDEDEDHE